VSEWLIYRGTGERHAGIERLPDPPSWRSFAPITRPPAADYGTVGWTAADLNRGSSYRAGAELHNPVNAALYLRRPLLVTGKPGVGKSTLAYSVAYELGLGPVLRWPITSSSTLKEGLYDYDAIGRLQDVNLHSAEAETSIGRYLRLGPLGTALLPADTPRVLLIDEIDKASIDLPNDLLSTFEIGEYEISELVRIADTQHDVAVSTADVQVEDDPTRVTIHHGLVRCRQFPLVIMTSNGERQFPLAFLRRCLTLEIEPPGLGLLTTIVEAQLGREIAVQASGLIERFHQRSMTKDGDLANDQLLNAIHLTCRNELDEDEKAELTEMLIRYLGTEPDPSWS
jgi:MoxR-like ATPase